MYKEDDYNYVYRVCTVETRVWPESGQDPATS